MARIRSVTGQAVTPVTDGWEMTVVGPGEWPSPVPGEGGDPPQSGGEGEGLAGVVLHPCSGSPSPFPRLPPWAPSLSRGGRGSLIPAPVPGTAAQALRDAGLWSFDAPAPLHDRDVVYRTRLNGHGAHSLRFHGLATLAEAWLDDTRILTSDSMFLAHEVPVTLGGEATLTLRFRALHPDLAARKGRARWRPRLAEPAGLRFVRTTLLGHMPGWCPAVHAVGPFRPVELVADAGPLRVRAADLRTAYDGRDGRLTLTLTVDSRDGARPPATVEVAGQTAALAWIDADTLRGDLTIPGVEPWWPHTHGAPALHAVAARIGDTRIDLGRTGFRSLEVDRGPDGQGFALVVNGERIFARGACWTPPDIVGLSGDRAAYEPGLTLLRDAGANMVRVGGTMLYEADAFFDLCDELGILVWQDAMLANFDYPTDAAFLDGVRAEIAQLLDRTQASPSLAVLCGGSEMEQQAAMLGLARAAWAQPVLMETLQGELAVRRPDAVFVPNSPSGGALPFIADSGVSHYYGVGAYQRPLDDARRAGVRFAAECLAFSHVPDGLSDGALGVPAVHHPRWKERVPRDTGASWDFEDVRDHYLETLYAVDPRRLRYEDPDRYLRLSRAVTGEVIESVFGEWRRAGSTCAGGLVWLWRDLWPGAGWGVVASDGTPKAAWHAMRRAFRPVQAALTDEGVNGLAVHLLNETAAAIPAVVTLTALRDGAVPVFRAERAVALPPRSAQTIPAAALSDRFFDLTHAYRFGPAAHDVVVLTLTRSEGAETDAEPIAQSFHFPKGRALPRADLGLTVEVRHGEDGWALTLTTRRFACSVHVEDDGYRAQDAWFHLPPGAARTVRLLPRAGTTKAPDGEVHALNASAPIRYRGNA